MTMIKNKSLSHKAKRNIVFKNWRRNISGKEKQNSKLPKEIIEAGF